MFASYSSMVTKTLNWCGYEKMACEEDAFSKYLTPLDFSGYPIPLSWQWEFPIPESIFEPIPLMESFPTDPIYTSIEEFENPFLCQEDFYIGYRNGIGIWDDLNFGFEVETGKEIILYNDNSKEAGESLIREKPKRVREEKSLGSNELTRSTISRYFYMPITQAAKELNIGLTLLKKRCRELGIRRWPHRKLISLQTLIKNVQELGKENRDVSREKLRNAVEILEQERKLMEEMPDMQLEEKTKKLRQACFKANYKKRKLMGMIDLPTSSTTNTWPESYDSLCGEIQTQKRGQSSM